FVVGQSIDLSPPQYVFVNRNAEGQGRDYNDHDHSRLCANVLVERAHDSRRRDHDNGSHDVPYRHEDEGRAQGKYDLLIRRIRVSGQRIAVSRPHTRRVLPTAIEPVLGTPHRRAGRSAHRCTAVVTELAAVRKRVSTVIAVHSYWFLNQARLMFSQSNRARRLQPGPFPSWCTVVTRPGSYHTALD